MSGSREKSLTRNQDLALAALVAQPTLGLAAMQAGVSEKTLYRWLHHDSLFKAEYLKLHRQIVNNAMLQLQKATNNAVNVTISLMNDPGTPASVRLAAARTTLEMALEALNLEVLEERIAALEMKLEEYEESRSQTGRTGKGITSPIR
jgi:hypothetical protein